MSEVTVTLTVTITTDRDPAEVVDMLTNQWENYTLAGDTNVTGIEVVEPQVLGIVVVDLFAAMGLPAIPTFPDGTTDWPALAQQLLDDSTSGQDRESYTDDQDRDEYTVDDEDTRGDR